MDKLEIAIALIKQAQKEKKSRELTGKKKSKQYINNCLKVARKLLLEEYEEYGIWED